MAACTRKAFRMFSPYSLFIGLRYTGSARRSQLVSFISRVSMLGMALGVAILIVVLSVMNGFDRELRNRILALVPELTVTAFRSDADWSLMRQTLDLPGVRASAEFSQSNAMLMKGREVLPVLAYGIDPQRESGVSILPQFLQPGTLESLATAGPVILVGKPLAEKLSVQRGDSLSVMVSLAAGAAANKLSIRRFTVLDIFDTGTEIDQAMVIMDARQLQAIATADNLTNGVRLRLDEVFAAPIIAGRLNQQLPPGFYASDWTRSHGNLYSAIQLSKRLVGLMLLTIIAVAAFNVISALIMVVNDKRSDIAILRTQGASRAGIMLIFIVQGSLIGAIGTFSGVVLGIVLSLSITDLVAWLEQLLQLRFLNSDVYPVNFLPADLRLGDVLLVASTALVMSVLATVYPAWSASRVQPAEALRYE